MSSEQTPSHFLAQRLDGFMNLFSYVREAKPEDIGKLPQFGFRLIPNKHGSVEETLGFTLNSFPYFMLTRILPYFHYYYDYSESNEIVLTIVYFDFYIHYVINVSQMQLACPVNIADLQSCKDSVKRMGSLLNVSEEITSICMNQPTFVKDHMKDLL